MPVLRRERAAVISKETSSQILPLSRIISSRNIGFDRKDDTELKKMKTHRFPARNSSFGLLKASQTFVSLYPISVRLIRTYKVSISLITAGTLYLLFQNLSLASIVKQDEHIAHTTILLPKSIVKTKFRKPSPLNYLMQPEFGGFDDLVVVNGGMSRQIKAEFYGDEKGKKSFILFNNDHQFDDAYFQFDDDEVHEKAVNDENKHCRYNSWQRYHFPTCNSFHETRIIGDKSNRFLG